MIKEAHYNTHYYIYPNQHDIFLAQLPKIAQKVENFRTIYSPKEFYYTLLHTIYQAYHHIYLTTLYLENDIGGKNIINAILYIKKNRPNIKIKIIVDWYRARRSRFGESTNYTNFNWYYDIIQKHPDIKIEIYGIPIHINELLGVFHLKGFIIDDKILYSGANINNEYLHIYDKYRYDRYHIIQNQQLSNIMLEYIETKLLSSQVVNKLGNQDISKKFNNNKNNIRLFRKNLRKVYYNFQNTNTNNVHSCSIIPLVGIGKNSILNKTIYHLISSTKNKIILCTPYFNIPTFLSRNLTHLLHTGKSIEIIVGDKVANDFYNPNQTCKSFKLINTIPYLYEINLRIFLKKLQKYIHNKQLIVRLWKKGINSYHIKGLWIDDDWQLITGSNLNPRSLRCDLENALLIYDPHRKLTEQKNKELNKIRIYTDIIIHYKSIETISNYPAKVKKIIRRIRHIKLDYLIKHLL